MIKSFKGGGYCSKKPRESTKMAVISPPKTIVLFSEGRLAPVAEITEVSPKRSLKQHKGGE